MKARNAGVDCPGAEWPSSLSTSTSCPLTETLAEAKGSRTASLTVIDLKEATPERFRVCCLPAVSLSVLCC